MNQDTQQQHPDKKPYRTPLTLTRVVSVPYKKTRAWSLRIFGLRILYMIPEYQDKPKVMLNTYILFGIPVFKVAKYFKDMQNYLEGTA